MWTGAQLAALGSLVTDGGGAAVLHPQPPRRDGRWWCVLLRGGAACRMRAAGLRRIPRVVVGAVAAQQPPRLQLLHDRG